MRNDPKEFTDYLTAAADFNAIKSRAIIKASQPCVCAHTGWIINTGEECLRRETNGGEVTVLHKDSALFKWFVEHNKVEKGSK